MCLAYETHLPVSFIDPTVMPPLKATETIGNRLQEQYLRWQPKVRTCASSRQ